ncbi:MAG: hypothetical protein HY589_04645 [Candidatus Omnitrophica bacterium]|nr:hypothetical protein [Candidatus Omnitrophota bacterium]
MRAKGLAAGFLGFYKGALGIVIEILATIALMAAAFCAGVLILTWFHK